MNTITLQPKPNNSMTEREFIEYMGKAFAERRSDVAEMCEEFLQKGTVSREPEQRFIYGSIPNTSIQIEYDTLTTLLSYRNKMDEEKEYRECKDHKYIDAGAMFMRGQYE